MPWAVAAAAVTAGAGIYSSSQASGAASKSADAARRLQEQTNNQNVSRAQPFVEGGYDASRQLQALTDSGYFYNQPNYLDPAMANIPNANNMADLEKTPGYQFTRDQGLQATQNSAAARGLGVSGAAMKGAADYATGLASSTYAQRFAEQQQKFGDYLGLNSASQGNLQNQYSRLLGQATLGSNAAAGVGTNAVGSSNAAGNALIAGGNDIAAGYTGANKAITGGINQYQQQQFLNQQQGGGGGSSIYGNLGNWLSGANTSAISQYANPYGATGNGLVLTGNSGLAVGGT